MRRLYGNSRCMWKKTADVAKLQDELTGALVVLARGIHEASEVGADTWRMMIEGLFATVTNVDFNEKTLRKTHGSGA